MKAFDIKKRIDVKKVTLALATFVALCTAYVLTTPAISVTQEAASSEAGFYTQGEQADAAAAGAASQEAAAADRAAGTPGPGTAPQAAAPADTDADAPAYPAQSFTETLKNEDDEVVLIASVEAPEGALPADSTLELESVKADEAKAAVEAAISYDDELAGKVQAAQTVAVDMTFKDSAGDKIEPGKPVTVKFTAAEVRDIDGPVLVRTLDADKALEDGKLDENGDPRQAEIVEDVAVVNQDEEDPTEGAEDTLKFETEDPGDYTIAELEPVEDSEDAAEGGDEPAADEAEAEPADQSFYGELRDDDGNVTLTVNVEAPAGALPDGATMQVKPVESAEVQDTVDQAVSEASESAKVVEIQAADITFYDAEGNEIEPQQPISVKMASPQIAEATQQPMVVHIDDEGNGAVVDTLTEKQLAKRDVQLGEDELAFDAAEFSVYAIAYTVDFHWEVDGKTFDFSIPGGGFVSFYDLVEALGIEENDTNTEEDEIQKLVDGVESITFSDSELVSVSKVEEDTTVGAIKERLGLECEYSAELTEEQIAEINAQTVNVGDWALISLKAFDTEEYLTVTMKTGEVFKINVTDDQENPLGLDGKSFAITASKNNNYYYLANDISSSNGNCLKAYTFNPNDGGTPQGSTWTFEWTGEGKKYLIHDNQNRYILIENDKVSLTDRETALANPITVVSREGKYSFVNEKNNQALNIYGSSGFGRWPYAESNSDFLMTLQDPSNLKKPGTITTADTSGLLQINLFDYGPENELDKEANNNSNPYSGGINSGHTLKFFSYGKNVGNGVNDFTGAGNGPRTGIVQDILGEDNYPVLNGSTESLNYLFGGASNQYVTGYEGLNHLFTKDENGYYHYDSNLNYAYYNSSNGNTDFTVYSKTFPEEGADSQHFGVGFFPFDDYDEYYNCIHGKNGFEHWAPHNYGTNKAGHYDHHFGMEMSAQFVYPPGGQYNNEDVIFHFSGDDDLWVYVDGVLIMDIGGVHNPVSGDINFKTGDVTVHGELQENFKDKYKRLTGNDWDDSDFSTHDFRVFYMERGGMYSNLELTFNLPLTERVPSGDFSFDKVSSENASLKLSGAEFSLYTDNVCGTPLTLADIPIKAVSNDEGVVTFRNIPYGTYYMKETVYPEGYEAKTPEEVFTVVMGESGTTISSSAGNVSAVTNQPIETTIDVLKVDRTDGATPLTGAKFKLRRYPTSSYQGYDKEWPEQEVSSNPETKGRLTFAGITVGYYELEETASPAGYVRVGDNPHFVVIADQSGELRVSFTDTELVTYANGTFTVKNTPGAALPHTGGPGTMLFTLAGLVLVAAAGILLVRRKLRLA